MRGVVSLHPGRTDRTARDDAFFQHRLWHHHWEKRRRRGVPGLYRPADPRRRRNPALRRGQCQRHRVSAVFHRRPGPLRHPRDDDGTSQPRSPGRRPRGALREAAAARHPGRL